jgi:hypothetical protein
MAALNHQPQGWEGQLGIGLETTWGSAVSLTQWLPGVDKIVKSSGLKPLDLAVGSHRRRHVAQRGIQVRGGVDAQVCPGRLDELFGLLDYESGYEGIYLQSATLQLIHSSDLVRTHTGVRVAGFTLRQQIVGDEGGGDLTAALDCIAKNSVTTVGAGTPNFDDAAVLAPYTGHELTMLVGGSEDASKRQIEIAWKFGLQADKWGTDRLLRSLPCGSQEVDLNLGIDLEDDVWIDRLENETEFEVDLTWERGENNLNINFPRCLIIDGADPEQQDKGNRTTIDPKIIVLETYNGDPEYVVTIDA